MIRTDQQMSNVTPTGMARGWGVRPFALKHWLGISAECCSNDSNLHTPYIRAQNRQLGAISRTCMLNVILPICSSKLTHVTIILLMTRYAGLRDRGKDVT